MASNMSVPTEVTAGSSVPEPTPKGIDRQVSNASTATDVAVLSSPHFEEWSPFQFEEDSESEVNCGVMGWWGAEDIRVHVNSGCGATEWESSREEERRICLSCRCSKLSIIWGLLIKYVVPGFLLVVLFDQVLRVMFKTLLLAPEYQFEGFLPFIVMVLCVLVVMIFPSLMEQSYDHKDDEMMKTVEMNGPDCTNDQVL